MISCTEFIPSYSELFTFLEEGLGREEVDRYWNYLFAPKAEESLLSRKIGAEGIRGCYSYWSYTLNEEAADFTMYLNEKAGWFQLVMHHCPSKGRLLELQETRGIRPYRDYCLHCDGYRHSIEKHGLKYIYNFTGTDRAACSILVYDPKIFNGQIIINEDTQIMDRRAEQNEYFHPGFHESMNAGLNYLGSLYGEEAIVRYLKGFTRSYYANVAEGVRERGLSAIRDMIQNTYHKEHADDALTVRLEDGALYVEVAYCPGVRFLKSQGAAVSEWYPLTTSVVMETLAEDTGCRFVMDRYDKETGAAAYHFTAKQA